VFKASFGDDDIAFKTHDIEEDRSEEVIPETYQDIVDLINTLLLNMLPPH